MKREPCEHDISLKTERARDEVLISRTLGGEKDAFDILVTKYRDRIFRLTIYMLGNQQEAEDAAQEVFVKAYRNLGKFRGQSSFFTWLYRIAVNNIYTQARKSARRWEIQRQVFRENTGISNPGPKTPEELAVAGELQDMVRAAITQLDPRFRQVLILKEIEGMEVGMVAEMLNLPAGTVKSRLFRAREDMRSILVKMQGFSKG